jgi:hypothetical protein
MYNNLFVFFFQVQFGVVELEVEYLITASKQHVHKD